MNIATFTQKHTEYPNSSRVWVYQTDRKLSVEEQAKIQVEMKAFTQQWAAHGKGLKASSGVLFESLLVLIVDQSQEAASGCSIDSSVHFIKALGVKYGFDCFNRNAIAYVKEGNLAFTNLQDLDKAKGAQVFNLATSTFGDIKENFVLNFEESALSKVQIDLSFKFSL
jgi:hypothetical protein